MNYSSTYLWFDLEYTTLDLSAAQILQLALVITDVHLKRIAPPLNLTVKLERETPVSPWVQENAAELLERCYASDVTLKEADERLSASIDAVIGAPQPTPGDRPVLAGNSIHCDWVLLKRDLPGLASRINYRLLDVSSIKLQWLDFWRGDTPDELDKESAQALKRYFPDFELNDEGARHDAYYDAQASAAELGYYRAQLSRSSTD